MPRSRIRSWNSLKALLLSVILAAPAAAAAAPEAGALLDWALKPPAASYKGRMMLTQWFGKQARAEESAVYSKGGLSRREFLAPDGTPTRVLVSDGERQEVHLVKKGRVLRGDAVNSYEKLMAPEHERELLLANYRLSARGVEVVAGRPCWVLLIEPTAAGKPSQSLCLDQQTKVVLENKRFLADRPFAAMIRFSRFEPDAKLDDDLFAFDVETATAAARGLEPDFMTLEQLNQATGKDAALPSELPAGFRFESADFFKVRAQTVRHARYTDGLSVLSLFLTDKPVRLPRGERLSGPTMPRASLRLSSSGKVLHWRRGAQHFTLLGDVSRELLSQIAAALK